MVVRMVLGIRRSKLLFGRFQCIWRGCHTCTVLRMRGQGVQFASGKLAPNVLLQTQLEGCCGESIRIDAIVLQGEAIDCTTLA